MWYVAFGALALSHAIITGLWVTLYNKSKLKKTTKHRFFRWWMGAFTLVVILSGIMCHIDVFSVWVFAFLPLGVLISLILLILVIEEN